MKNMFFSVAGRASRREFWIGFACASAFIFAFNELLRFLGFESMVAFFLSLPFPFIAIYMLYCIYGKRLHDMGWTVRPFFLMIFLELLALIMVGVIFGAGEYVAEFSQFDRKDAIDPEIVQDIQKRYQENMQPKLHIVNAVLVGIPALFTLWIGLAKSDPDENAYGTARDRVKAFD